MEAQSMLILSGRYIGFLPRHIGDGFAERGLMRVLRPEVHGFQSQHFAAVRKREATSPLNRAFLQELRRQARMKRQPVDSAAPPGFAAPLPALAAEANPP